ncbi:hypothetical protein G6F35_018172 [Rhizopus arrhizus]|nr:hypothetical protein G6F35_018172 [Rhizopus arrhizus]
MAHQQFAVFAGGGRLAGVGHDAHLHVVFLAAEAAGADVARLLVGDDDGAGAGFACGPRPRRSRSGWPVAGRRRTAAPSSGWRA